MEIAAKPVAQQPSRTVQSSIWHEHMLPLLFFAGISIAFSWPLVRDFTTRFIGVGTGDPFHSVWLLWNVKQWVLGRQPLFYAPLLYYPYGTPLIMDGVGPISGIFALPFWGFGAVAAYNGAILVGVWLSGYCMYLLARGLAFERDVALFAGIVLQVSPVHLAGVYGHIEKTFVGFLPLALLCLYYALNPERKWWYAVLTGLVLLLTALYSGYQFIYACFGVAFFTLAAFFAVDRSQRWPLLKRVILVGGSTFVLTGPFLLAILITSNNPLYKTNVNVGLMSPFFSPDALQFILPSFYHITAPLVYGFQDDALTPIRSQIGGLEQSSSWYGIWLETAVTLPLTCFFFCSLALKYSNKLARRWLLFTSLIVLIALGPLLRIFGSTRFTAYKLPLLLPYAIITSLPGLDFMRAPGRWMMIGAVGLGIAASFGLAWLKHRWPRQSRLIVFVAIILLLAESWPRPWPQSILPRTPEFYQQLRQDNEVYGVFDLPIGTPEYASTYQMYQMTHHKGIAWGYLSHTYTDNPLPLLQDLMKEGIQRNDIRLNGSPVNLFAYAQAELAQAGYRYVVWHKTLKFQDSDQKAQQLTAEFISEVFGPQAKPVSEDDLVRVYRVVSPASQADNVPTIRLAHNWYSPAKTDRWAQSPATIQVNLPRPQCMLMQIIPAAIYVPSSKSGMGNQGVLNVQIGSRPAVAVNIKREQITTVPLSLPAGSETITLALQSGNFQPSAYGGSGNSLLSFSIRSINFQQVQCGDT